MKLKVEMLPQNRTAQERLVEKTLKSLGFRYEAQAGFGKFTVDFYIPELNWIVEADGAYGHFKKADKNRDKALLEMGVGKIVHIKEQDKVGIETQLREALFND